MKQASGRLLQLRIGQAVAGRVGPERIARGGRRPGALGQRLHRAVGDLGGLRVVEQRGRDGERHDPAVVAGLGVDHAQFQMAARAHRREQRRQVVVEVLLGRRPGRPGPDPLAERQPVLRHVPRPAVPPYAHHRGVEHMIGPRLPRLGVQWLGPRSARRRSPSTAACRVERQPVGLPTASGELANAATRTAPSRCASHQRRPCPRGPGSSWPASRHTCTEAEVHIMARPAGPVRSRHRSRAS